MSVNIIITKTSTTKLTLSHSPDWVHLGVTFLGFEDKNVKRIVFSFKRTAVQVRSWNTPFHFCSTKPLACASPHHGSYADSFQSQTPASRILGASFCLLGIGTDLRLEKNACILLNSRKAAWEIGKTKNKKRFSEGCCHNAVCGPACVCLCVKADALQCSLFPSCFLLPLPFLRMAGSMSRCHYSDKLLCFTHRHTEWTLGICFCLRKELTGLKLRDESWDEGDWEPSIPKPHKT